MSLQPSKYQLNKTDFQISYFGNTKMNPITYSLKEGQSSSREYYETVGDLTDIILLHSNDSLRPVVDGFTNYLMKYNLEQIRGNEEYILDLINFGVLWKSYAGIALNVRHAPFITMALMAEWRKKHQRIKPYIDIARGLITTLILLPGKTKRKSGDIPTLGQIDHVCKWLEATGEFNEEALRFIRWRAYWQTLNPGKLKEIFITLNDFTDYFIKISSEMLGKYTLNADSFVKNSAARYRWREDRISCMRASSEYHLNMVGAVLMNRAFRKEFERTKKKVLLLPGCMRGKSSDECEAVKVKGGLSCKGCQPECRVNQLRESGRRNNFEVYIIPHASDLSLWSPHKGEQDCGVVASACITQLIAGGLELKRYDVPAQCVPLDYCGCKKHWDDTGFPTELNIRELKRILEFVTGSPHSRG